jgi:hypothetical protein
VTAAGGGGILTVYKPGRLLRGIETVIDKDLCSELLAELDADFFIMATDADAVYIDWGKPINGQSVPPIRTPCVPVAFRRARWGRKSCGVRLRGGDGKKGRTTNGRA